MAQSARCLQIVTQSAVRGLASTATFSPTTITVPCASTSTSTAFQTLAPLALHTLWAQPGPACWQSTWRHLSIQSVEEHENSCWSCQHHMKRGSFACQGCEKIQPVDPTLNYFELLAVPNMQFDVDLAKLEQQYKLLQWSLHPDKVVLRPPEERAHAAQQATLINHAYSILRHPLSRANYILSLKGIQSGDDFEGTIDDKELLMEVLEAREQVENTEDVGELREMLASTQQQQTELVQRISDMLKQGAYAQAVPTITHLTYLVKLEREIVSKLPHN